jgi:hypothetical protein
MSLLNHAGRVLCVGDLDFVRDMHDVDLSLPSQDDLRRDSGPVSGEISMADTLEYASHVHSQSRNGGNAMSLHQQHYILHPLL